MSSASPIGLPFHVYPRTENEGNSSQPPESKTAYVSAKAFNSKSSVSITDDGIIEKARNFKSLDHPENLCTPLDELLHRTSNKFKISTKRDIFIEIASLSSAHYSEQIHKALDFLIECLETDPVDEQSAEGLVILVNKLSGLLARNNANISSLTQLKLAKAYYLSIELMLRQYEKGHHLNAIAFENKNKLHDTKDGYTNIIKMRKSNFSGPQAIVLEHHYLMAATEEAIRYLPDDKSRKKMVFETIKTIAGSLKELHDKNIEGFAIKLEGVFTNLKRCIKENWYRSFYFLRLKEADAMGGKFEDLHFIQAAMVANLRRKKTDPDQNFLMGSIEILRNIAKYTRNEELRQVALGGRIDEESNFPGLITFLSIINDKDIKQSLARTLLFFWNYPTRIPHKAVGQLLLELYGNDTLLGPIFHDRSRLTTYPTNGQGGVISYETLLRSYSDAQIAIDRTKEKLRETLELQEKIEEAAKEAHQKANSQIEQAEKAKQTALEAAESLKNKTNEELENAKKGLAELQSKATQAQTVAAEARCRANEEAEKLKAAIKERTSALEAAHSAEQKALDIKNELDHIKSELGQTKSELKISQDKMVGISKALLTREEELLSLQTKMRGALGKEAWIACYGDPGETPLLPANIDQLLDAKCKLFPGKTVRQSSVLVLISKNIEGTILHPNRCSELMMNPKSGKAKTCIRIFDTQIGDEHGDRGFDRSRWAIVTRDVVPGTRGKTPAEQLKIIEEKGYKQAKILHVIVASMLEYAVNGNRLYGNDPWTEVRVQEKVSGHHVCYGKFTERGSCLTKDSGDDDSVGMVAVMEL